MVKEVSGIICREQAERIALDEVNAWRGVENVNIESIKKICEEDDERSYWKVNGKYEWNGGISGSFMLHISEEGNISFRISSAYPVPESRSVPYP